MLAHRDLRATQGLRRRTARAPLAIEVLHQERGGLVVHVPETDEHARRAGVHEGTREAHDPLAAHVRAAAGLAGRQHGEVGAQLEAEDLRGRQQPVLVLAGCERERGEGRHLEVDQAVAGEMHALPAVLRPRGRERGSQSGFGGLLAEQGAVARSGGDRLDLRARPGKADQLRPPALRKDVHACGRAVDGIADGQDAASAPHVALAEHLVGRCGRSPHDLPVVGHQDRQRHVRQLAVRAHDETHRTDGDPESLEEQALDDREVGRVQCPVPCLRNPAEGCAQLHGLGRRDVQDARLLVLTDLHDADGLGLHVAQEEHLPLPCLPACPQAPHDVGQGHGAVRRERLADARLERPHTLEQGVLLRTRGLVSRPVLSRLLDEASAVRTLPYAIRLELACRGRSELDLESVGNRCAQCAGPPSQTAQERHRAARLQEVRHVQRAVRVPRRQQAQVEHVRHQLTRARYVRLGQPTEGGQETLGRHACVGHGAGRVARQPSHAHERLQGGQLQVPRQHARGLRAHLCVQGQGALVATAGRMDVGECLARRAGDLVGADGIRLGHRPVGECLRLHESGARLRPRGLASRGIRQRRGSGHGLLPELAERFREVVAGGGIRQAVAGPAHALQGRAQEDECLLGPPRHGDRETEVALGHDQARGLLVLAQDGGGFREHGAGSLGVTETKPDDADVELEFGPRHVMGSPRQIAPEPLLISEGGREVSQLDKHARTLADDLGGVVGPPELLVACERIGEAARGPWQGATPARDGPQIVDRGRHAELIPLDLA